MANDKDAERYQWLRSRTHRDAGFTLMDFSAAIAVSRDTGYPVKTLDTLIDAAMRDEAPIRPKLCRGHGMKCYCEVCQS